MPRPRSQPGRRLLRPPASGPGGEGSSPSARPVTWRPVAPQWCQRLVAAPAPSRHQNPLQPPPLAAERKGWLDRLKAGLRKTGSSIATVFTGTQIDDALYEELEEALLMADTGVKATQHLLEDLKAPREGNQDHRPRRREGPAGRCPGRLLRPLEKPW